MDVLVYGIDFNHKKGEFCQRTTLPYYFISYFRTDYVAEIASAPMRGKAGDYLILEPGRIIYHGPTPEADEGFRNDWMYIAGEDLAELLKRYPLPLNEPFHIDDSFYLSSAIERIDKEKDLSLDGWEDVCNMTVRQAVIDLYRAYKKQASASATDKLEEVRGAIMRNYKHAWTLEEMAQCCGYSQSYFCTLYKSRYGLSPVNDLLNHRLEQAKRLMLYARTPINEIADAVGFSSVYYFSKYFKKKEGISPKDYRQSRLLSPALPTHGIS